ncbi:hypothetical protein [Mesoterricola sediminis]|uniref:NinB protein n=1 Tax=Mesoterricola sediminis TaxID=2927980 RepID=A0AA48H2H8_9BACT|nr:hypothetical protein [Mesoterricola sediminis]BDU76276.1 hypothetical protein METESE_12340 [Mesoterricola sediminis]
MSQAMKPRTWVLDGEKATASLWQFLKANAKAMALEGKPLTCTVAPYRSKRSIQANAYYWGVTLKQISEQAWVENRQFTPEVWHEYFKDTFAPRMDKPFGGSFALGTHDMSVEEFHAFTCEVERFAAQHLGVVFIEERIA